MTIPEDYIIEPFCVIIDSREQFPFSFKGIAADAQHRRKDGTLPPLIVPVKTAGLKTGDYSIEGMETRISVERKSLSDSLHTFCHDRDRFERELERLNAMEFAGVVIEAGWPSLLRPSQPFTKFTPKSYFRSIIAWNVRYPRVHFWACETRNFAERVTFRWLQRFWQDEQKRLKELSRDSA